MTLPTTAPVGDLATAEDTLARDLADCSGFQSLVGVVTSMAALPFIWIPRVPETESAPFAEINGTRVRRAHIGSGTSYTYRADGDIDVYIEWPVPDEPDGETGEVVEFNEADRQAKNLIDTISTELRTGTRDLMITEVDYLVGRTPESEDENLNARHYAIMTVRWR